MKKITSLRKKYYTGGLLSAIFIPILFLHFIYPSYERLHTTALDCTIVQGIENENTLKKGLYNIIPIKGYNYQNITVKKNFDKASEANYIFTINQIKNKNIDKTGVKFQFSDTNTYADFVGILNVLLKTNSERYGIDMKSKSIYVINTFYDSIDECIFMGFDYESYYEPISFYDNFKFNMKYFDKDAIFMLFGYIILLFFVILKPKIHFEY